jgi:membrane-associated phospholipid phosphatase
LAISSTRSHFIHVIKAIHTVLFPFLIILAACIIVKLLFNKETIYFYINGLHFSAGDVFFPWYTHLGEVPAAAVLIIILLFSSYRMGFVLLTTYLFTTGINFGLKSLFGAPRPFQYFHDRVQDLYLVPGVHMLSGFMSFPSGHTVCAFTSATVLTYYARNKAWGYLYLLLAMLVGYSRIYLSQHFFEDVVMGAGTGIVLSIIWLTFIDKQAFLHTPSWERGLLKK